jgi:hypothetical protein
MKKKTTDFKKLVLGSAGKKRVRKGNWSLFGIGEAKTDNPRFKGKGGKCIMCGKKLSSKDSYLCSRCAKYDTKVDRFMKGKTNKVPKW